MKKFLTKKWVKYTIIEFIVFLILFFLMLFYQNKIEKLAIINAIQVSGILLFAFGWIFFVNNEGIFDVAIYGTQYFLKSLIGKRMKKSLYETRVDKKLVPSSIYITMWIQGIIWIIISFIIYYAG